MTAPTGPARHGVPRHRRVVEDTTDDVGVPVVDGWLDPETAPLAVYRDRDLPYAPPAVQRDRARVAAAASATSTAVVPAPLVATTPAVSAAPTGSSAPTVARAVAAPVGAATALVDRLGRARVAAGAVLVLVVVLVAAAVVLLGGGPPGGRPGPGAAPTASAHVRLARVPPAHVS